MISETEKEYILALLSHTDIETFIGIGALFILFGFLLLAILYSDINRY